MKSILERNRITNETREIFIIEDDGDNETNYQQRPKKRVRFANLREDAHDPGRGDGTRMIARSLIEPSAANQQPAVGKSVTSPSTASKKLLDEISRLEKKLATSEEAKEKLLSENKQMAIDMDKLETKNAELLKAFDHIQEHIQLKLAEESARVATSQGDPGIFRVHRNLIHPWWHHYENEMLTNIKRKQEIANEEDSPESQ